MNVSIRGVDEPACIDFEGMSIDFGVRFCELATPMIACSCVEPHIVGPTRPLRLTVIATSDLVKDALIESLAAIAVTTHRLGLPYDLDLMQSLFETTSSSAPSILDLTPINDSLDITDGPSLAWELTRRGMTTIQGTVSFYEDRPASWAANCLNAISFGGHFSSLTGKPMTPSQITANKRVVTRIRRTGISAPTQLTVR